MTNFLSQFNKLQPKIKAKIKEKYGEHRQKIKKTLLAFAVFLVILNAVLSINNLQRSQPILGLKLEGHSLNFKNRSQIEKLIQKETNKDRGNLKFVYKDKVVEVKKEEIGAKVDSASLANKLIAQGRTGGFFSRITFQVQALVGLKNEKIKGDISQTLLNLKIIEIQNDFDKVAKPIQPDFAGDITKTLPAEDGIKTDTNKLTIAIADNVFKPPGDPLPLPVIKTFTSHEEKELLPIKKQALDLTKQPISIESGGLIFTLTGDELKKLLTVAERPDPKDPKKLILVLRLEDILLSQKLGDYAAKVENITHAEFDHHDSFAAIYSQFYSGKRKLVHIPTGQRLVQKVLGATTGPKIAYLTFDDGPNSVYHPMILDILKAYNVTATFFLVGQNAQRDSEIAKRTYADGHKVGNHSLTHAFLPGLASQSITKELSTTNDILKLFNKDENVAFFRPPYGGVNLAVKQNVENLHLKMFLWDVDPRDWSEPETQELVNRVVNNTTPGSDILLHSNHLATVKALPKIIETLRNQGYSFETLN